VVRESKAGQKGHFLSYTWTEKCRQVTYTGSESGYFGLETGLIRCSDQHMPPSKHDGISTKGGATGITAGTSSAADPGLHRAQPSASWTARIKAATSMLPLGPTRPNCQSPLLEHLKYASEVRHAKRTADAEWRRLLFEAGSALRPTLDPCQ
jgi:hypothetical protein